jgi:hypothetical protein
LTIQIAPQWRCGAAMSIFIDWMTATHGSPAAEVVRRVLLFRVGVLPVGMPAAQCLTPALFRRTFVTAYLRAYRRLHPLSDVEIEAWIPILAAAGSLGGSGQRKRCCCS